MWEKIILLIALEAVMMGGALAVILLMRRRGVTVRATVRRVEVDDAAPDRPAKVSVTYSFPWEGRDMEITREPRRNLLPPREGEQVELRWDAGRGRLLDPISGQSPILAVLAMAFVLSILVSAAAAVSVLTERMTLVIPMIVLIFVMLLGLILWMGRRQCQAFQEQLERGVLQPVRAEFSDHVRRRDSDGDTVYVPVYRCFWEGRTWRIETDSGRRPYRPGDTVTLYRNINTGSVTEAPKNIRP